MRSRVLVVFYSRTGNTRRVAREIATLLDADIEEIVDSRNRKGIIGYLRSGFEAARARIVPIAPPAKDPSGYDLVAIGGPIWASAVASPVRSYLAQVRDKLPDVAFFITHGGTGRQHTMEQMAELCGKAPLAAVAVREHDLAGPAAARLIADFARGVAGALGQHRAAS